MAYLILFGAMFCFSLTNVLFKRINQELPTYATMAAGMAVIFVLSLALSLVTEKSAVAGIKDVKGVLYIVLIAGVANFFAFLLLLKGMQLTPIWQVQLFYLLTPVLGAFFAYWILGEDFSARLWLGLSLMSVGLYLAVK